MADAWEQLEFFDVSGSCIQLRQNENGEVDAIDITEGLKMANRSGRDAQAEKKTVLTKCMSCHVDLPHVG